MIGFSNLLSSSPFPQSSITLLPKTSISKAKTQLLCSAIWESPSAFHAHSSGRQALRAVLQLGFSSSDQAHVLLLPSNTLYSIKLFPVPKMFRASEDAETFFQVFPPTPPSTCISHSTSSLKSASPILELITLRSTSTQDPAPIQLGLHSFVVTCGHSVSSLYWNTLKKTDCIWYLHFVSTWHLIDPHLISL